MARTVAVLKASEVIPVTAGDATYEVVVGHGVLADLGSRIRHLLRGPRCLIVADENTSRLFAATTIESLRAAGFESSLAEIPAGESSKSFAHLEAITDQMTAAGLDRSSFVVALGGGVIGDLAGFASAIYHRGIPCVQVPTTLLAQVDSSIGGKTAIDTAFGKNLIGAFHQPTMVIADLNTLETLPTREFSQGFAEIIKYAIIADPSLFQLLEHFQRSNLEELVRRSVAIKATFVSRDEQDRSGERAILNFGHTVGHAIEKVGGYGHWLHGEALSLGIIAACDVSVQTAGFPEAHRRQVIAMLEAFELPTRLPADFPRSEILSALQADKKFERGHIRFVVASRLGSAHLASNVTLQEIEHAIARL